MNKIKYFCVIIFLLVTIACFGQRDKVVILNKDNSWEKSFFSYPLFFSNAFWINTRQMVDLKLLDTSKYVLDIPAHEPLFFNFSRNWKMQFVYLFPGDTLKFITTNNETIPYQFSGTRPSDELMFFSLLEAAGLGYVSNDGNRGLEITDRLNFQYVTDQTFERYQKRLKFLNDKLSSGKFTDQGSKVITQALYYKYLAELLFPHAKATEAGFDNAIVPASYKAKVRELSAEFNSDTLLYLRDYREFAFLYARFLMLESTGAKNTDQVSLLSFYKTAFTGEKRDFLLFDEVYGNYMRSADVSNVVDVVDSIQNRNMRDALISIHEKLNRMFSPQAFGAELETPEGKRITLKEVLAMYHQKSIYLDFWATWCGPCLMEMPRSGKLSQEFKNDNIDFIYISIDEDKQKWRKKITTLPQGKNIHHYNLEDGRSFIAREAETSAVPWYVLIGKGNQVISFNAPRPGSVEIRELISKSVDR